MVNRKLPTWIQFASLSAVIGMAFTCQHVIESRCGTKDCSAIISSHQAKLGTLAFVYISLRFLFSLEFFRFSESSEIQVLAAIIVMLLVAFIWPPPMYFRESSLSFGSLVADSE